MNVVHYAGIKALERYHQAIKSRPKMVSIEALIEKEVLFDLEDDPCHPKPQFIIYLSDVLDGIRRELIKEGKPFAL